MESPNHYLQQLYPLQDKFLRFLDRHNNKEHFYLTGGTALSRCYYAHRYSDDLDFFSKSELGDFREIVSDILQAARQDGFSIETETVSDHFYRIYLKQEDVALKIDFVNEVVFYWGQWKSHALFSCIDNEMNILANKINCVYRYEVKDMADIWILAKRCSFFWREIIEAADKKSPVDPAEVSKIIKTLPRKELEMVKWAFDVNLDSVYSDLHAIADDILLGRINSLNIEAP